ncbi:phosphatase PAP2 family protein [uncultured Helicobacter sp.]|uniref:phosphatase PAP2 family protein n=1 Tax=uncultured Helicobacter sp. TaxID=175537 RepID=UPI002597AF66|nr:phosphatase PAP2 family protein [uncultured Helicobacter sp.]
MNTKSTKNRSKVCLFLSLFAVLFFGAKVMLASEGAQITESNKLSESSTSQNATHNILQNIFSSHIFNPQDNANYLRKFGDTAQFLPALSIGYTLLIKDFVGLKQQIIATVAVVATTYVIKYAFHGLASVNTNLATISKRPNGESYEGFPSGHTSAAFSAAGFLQKRYGLKLGLPAIAISSLVGFSRVEAERHTTLQVICGALLGFCLSFFLTSAKPKNRPHNRKNHKLDSHTQIIECAVLALLFI